MTDYRLTDADIDLLESGQIIGSDLNVRAAEELRAQRALIDALKAHGCPKKYHEGRAYCVWCEAAADADGEIDHDEMDDGGPCLWPRIEQA